MIYTDLLSLLLAEYAANQKCSAILLCSADSIYPIPWSYNIYYNSMPNTNRHVDCQEYLTAVLRIAKITRDPQDRPAYSDILVLEFVLVVVFI